MDFEENNTLNYCQNYQVQFDIYGKEIPQSDFFQSPELKKFYSQFAKEQTLSAEKNKQEQECLTELQEYNKENMNPLTTDFVFTPLKPLANRQNINNIMQENQFQQYLQPPNLMFNGSYSPQTSNRINRSPLNDITEQFYGPQEITKKKSSVQKLLQLNQLNSTPKPFYNQAYNNSKSQTKNLRI